MDILYYSNYCKHSKNVINILTKHGMNEKISFICIDKIKKDPQTNQVFIFFLTTKNYPSLIFIVLYFLCHINFLLQ